MKPYQPNANELAILVIIIIQRYGRERGRDVTRFRFARKSLRRLAIRDRLRDALVDEWIDIMALQHNWLVTPHDEEFILIKAETTQTWTKIASKRGDNIISRLRNGDGTAIDDAENEITLPIVSDEDDDEE